MSKLTLVSLRIPADFPGDHEIRISMFIMCEYIDGKPVVPDNIVNEIARNLPRGRTIIFGG